MSEEMKHPETAPEAASAPETAPAPEAAPQAGQATAETAQEETPKADTEKKEKEKFSLRKNREMEALKAKLEKAEQEAGTIKEQLLRTAAEYENYRKRSAREADTKFNDGISFALTQILGILDTLDMAASAPCTDENYKKGVSMTLDKTAKALENLHVEELDVLGKPFDPTLCNAVQQVPAEEGVESGTVVTVFQKGYRLGDKIIRHAAVVVSE